MAANMAPTNITLVKNTGTVCTGTAIGADTVTLTITPTQACHKMVVIITSTGATGYDIDVAAGDYWAAKAMTTVTIAQNVPRAFVFEAARFMKNVAAADDTIVMTLGADATTTTSFQVLELP